LPDSLPAFLSLASVLDALASRVGAILDASSNALKTVADRLCAGGVVDGLADAAASCTDKASSGFGDATESITNLSVRQCCCQSFGRKVIRTVEVPALTAPSAPPLLDPVSIGMVVFVWLLFGL